MQFLQLGWICWNVHRLETLESYEAKPEELPQFLNIWPFHHWQGKVVFGQEHRPNSESQCY